MEIIKHGKLYKVGHFATCPICECEFKYTYDDIQSEFSTASTGEKTQKSYILCPECNFKITIGTLSPTLPMPSIPYYPYPQSPYGGPIVTYMDNNTKCSCDKGECSCTK
jgi:hypothetical protein